jgi:hypothetical protein
MAKPQDSQKEYIWGKRKSKMWIIIVIAAVVILGGVAGYVVFGLNTNQSRGTSLNNSHGTQALARRAIDGVYVASDQANFYPVAVMIENLVSSRPPSGLSKANVVYEALAEGGITRFMALYAGKLDISEIGPVRSARPYYIDWDLEYKALYAHAGGSPEAIGNIKTYNVFDLNQFYNSQYFWRDTTRNLPIEHTLYTSAEKLAFALRDLKAPAQGNYTAWKFKDDVVMADRPTTDKSIGIDFSSFNYKVEYKYDPTTNAYVRYLAGQIHKDRDGTEIHAKNVIVQKVKTTLADEQRLAMETVGQGEAIIFRDGTAVTGRWEKKSRTDRTLFYTEDGQQVEFNAGQTWVEVVPTDRDIVYN